MKKLDLGSNFETQLMFRLSGIFFFTALLTSLSFSQGSAFKSISQGDKEVKKLNYLPAIRSYQQALEMEPANTKALDRLVDIYLNELQIYDSALIYIEKRLENIGPDTNYLVYYNYANCLRLQEEHKQAIDQYKFFLDYGLRRARPDHPLIVEVNKNINYALNALKNQKNIYEPYEVENMDFFINSVDAEYTPVYLEKDNLLLYNARYKDYSNEQRDADNDYFENIYYFDLEESVASTYNESIEQKTHQSVVSKVWDGDSVLVFYQNRIWLTTLSEDRLNSLTPLPAEFGNFYYQPHGIFSADRKSFIFSARSEMGNLDIYVSNLKGGVWTTPESISPHINSSEDEDGPYLSKDGQTLYFSSKGHASSGGYDFYISTLENGQWSVPQNMGYPMNSAGDDIYLSWNADERNGFFSSNRTGGFGGMDIYAFGLIKKTIKGIATDQDGEILADTKVELIESVSGEIITVTASSNGSYSFLVDPEKEFKLKGTKEKYFENEKTVDTYGEDDVVVADLQLEKDPGISLYLHIEDAASGEPLDSVKIVITDNMIDVKDSVYTGKNGSHQRPLPDKKLQDRGSYNFTLQKDGYLVHAVTYNVLFDREGSYNVFKELKVKMEKVEVGLDLNDIIDLNPIYFDYNKAIIRPDAAVELDKIVKVMNDNPKMVIELGSHTDARGSAKQNQNLSERRANASVEYIKARISNPSRITGKGYGESKPVNDCIDGVECSEARHQENRRTEFIIIEM